jgi:hypothetical protein
MVTFSQEITNAGGTFSYDATTWGGGDAILYLYVTSPVTLAADVAIVLTTPPYNGNTFKVLWSFDNTVGIDLNGRTFSVDTFSCSDYMLYNHATVTITTNATGTTFRFFSLDPIDDGIGTSGNSIKDHSLDLVLKSDTVTRGSILISGVGDLLAAVDAKTNGNILIGDGTDLNSVAQSGDVIFSTAGVSAIQAGVIVNADVNASAAITRSKLASGTADYVVKNSNTGVLSEEAQLATVRGGTGIDSSASTGFSKIAAGTWSVSSIAVDRDLDVSWETGEVGDFKIQMGFAGTLVEIYEYVTKTLVTVGGTITPKNNAGTTMGSGTITHAAADPRGTTNTATPTTNNTFVAGDILTFTTATATAGKAHLSLKFTRNT